jgi:hypothetical protein
MKEGGIAILIMLAFIGMGMAFAFVGLMISGTGTSYEDVWMYQEPLKEEFKLLLMLTEEQQQKAIEIAKQNETVKQYLDQGYEMEGVSATFTTPTTEGVVVTLKGDKKESIYAIVDLNEGKVAEIDRLSGEGMMVKGNETGIRIAIGGKESKLIRAPDIRELTEEERAKAREIALSDLEVQNIINGKNYEMEIRPTGVIITNEVGEIETKFSGASVMFELEDGTIYFVHVDLEKGKVIRMSPPLLPPPMPPINK